MTWELWPKAEPMRLAYYVNSDALHWFDSEINHDDLISQHGGIFQIVQAIYNALRSRKKPIKYAREKYHYDKSFQKIRSPKEVLGEHSPMGTCLDLAIVFCGLCLAHDLLPYLIVLEGHALAAVSLKNTRREWEKNRAGRIQFDSEGLQERGLLTAQQPEQLEQFYQLVEAGIILPIECTGFAHSDRLGQGQSRFPEGLERQEDGTLTFERAVQAGREQLKLEVSRPFQFALDIAIAQAYISEPYSLRYTDEHLLIVNERPQSYIPKARSSSFQPRPGEFEAIEKLLFEDRTENISPRVGLVGVGVLGMGGIGKTELALQIAHRYKERYPSGVFWTTATGDSIAEWQRQFEELAVNTEYLPPGDDVSHPEKEANRARHICRYLVTHYDALLILDNVENPELVQYALQAFAGREATCTILYTSRNTVVPTGIKTHSVVALSEEGALRLLLVQRPNLCDAALTGNQNAEACAAMNICQYVERLPLALTLLSNSCMILN